MNIEGTCGELWSGLVSDDIGALWSGLVSDDIGGTVHCTVCE